MDDPALSHTRVPSLSVMFTTLLPRGLWSVLYTGVPENLSFVDVKKDLVMRGAEMSVVPAGDAGDVSVCEWISRQAPMPNNTRIASNHEIFLIARFDNDRL